MTRSISDNQDDPVYFKPGQLKTAYDLLARSMLFDEAPKDERTRFARNMKSFVRKASYHPTVFNNLYHMTHEWVADWKWISSVTAPWEEKNQDERIRHIQHVYALNDTKNKNKFFKNPYPTSVTLHNREDVGCLMGARRLFKESRDLICVTPESVDYEEAWTMSCCLHEQSHLQMTDFHNDWYDNFDVDFSNMIMSVDHAIDLRADRKPFIDQAEEWRFASSHLASLYEEAGQGYDLSPADICGIAMRLSTQNTGENYNWYQHSPEEGVVRVVQIYAGALFSRNKNMSEADDLFTSLMTENQFSKNNASIELFLHIEKGDPSKTFSALGFWE